MDKLIQRVNWMNGDEDWMNERKERCMKGWIPGLDGWEFKNEWFINGWMDESIPGLDWIDKD